MINIDERVSKTLDELGEKFAALAIEITRDIVSPLLREIAALEAENARLRGEPPAEEP
jgi:hypothetical protein